MYGKSREPYNPSLLCGILYYSQKYYFKLTHYIYVIPIIKIYLTYIYLDISVKVRHINNIIVICLYARPRNFITATSGIIFFVVNWIPTESEKGADEKGEGTTITLRIVMMITKMVKEWKQVDNNEWVEENQSKTLVYNALKQVQRIMGFRHPHRPLFHTLYEGRNKKTEQYGMWVCTLWMPPFLRI